MSMLRTLAVDFQALFAATEKGQERLRWLLLTLQAIIVPITASRTSSLLRAIETLFGVMGHSDLHLGEKGPATDH